MYENRFGFTELLYQMGANIALSRACLGHRKCRYTYKNYLHSAVIIGPTPLSAAAIEIPDLRAGFAYLIAALTAPGESTITGLQHLERGHIDLVARLTALGADVRAEDL
jgi:UDP-N-acetylglucosamine 1-carboxyvinyltransferase